MSNLKIDHTLPNARSALRFHLFDLIAGQISDRKMVFVCIGTDRSTGDSLGPLVGSRLETLLAPDDCSIYGTLENPVHAVNLTETLQTIKRIHQNPFIIAIDACLGQLSSVGMISVGVGPLKPGAGVNKNLPEVGDIHITGIVNVGGFMEYFVLQNTRLSVVMKMAECIAQTLAETVPSLLRVPPYRDVRLESNYL
ncbi:spore protease YyaC [Effusibacillus lacus]|uniref:Spore protease YyaC n=1 Tax=Effusibacillus lacus TaxID=1348429 RepID=A0A292YJ01_9BACL|nr:spore protease YyaC [Effusibacillus lacus]TCS75181.1 putative sporulation protein YyaC [Effusibacillus lacus]GAX89126.1 spore protease YyaC [Effusibacillus lacus]